MDEGDPIIPDEIVARGLRTQKSAGQRVKELIDEITKKEEQIEIINELAKEHE